MNKKPTLAAQRADHLAPHFLNVDLEIESKFELAGLEAELEKNKVALGKSRGGRGFLLCLESVPECQLRFGFNFLRCFLLLPKSDNPDERICKLCSLLEGLSAKGRRAWNSAHKKEFDVGYDAVQSQFASQFSLRTDTLRRMANLGATLGGTFYRLSPKCLNPRERTAPPKRRMK